MLKDSHFRAFCRRFCPFFRISMKCEPSRCAGIAISSFVGLERQSASIESRKPSSAGTISSSARGRWEHRAPTSCCRPHSLLPSRRGRRQHQLGHPSIQKKGPAPQWRHGARAFRYWTRYSAAVSSAAGASSATASAEALAASSSAFLAASASNLAARLAFSAALASRSAFLAASRSRVA